MDINVINDIAQASGPASDVAQEYGRKAGKAIALGIGAGLGTIGPGIGVGYIFGKVIEFAPAFFAEVSALHVLGDVAHVAELLETRPVHIVAYERPYVVVEGAAVRVSDVVIHVCRCKPCLSCC